MSERDPTIIKRRELTAIGVRDLIREGIMASGHVNRTQRLNTWLHRPNLQREDSSCQPGAVHTWLIASFRGDQEFWML
jgi:hypothetical protein